ncbi:hypothetical protein [Candidatus Harpocratesius sp.]
MSDPNAPFFRHKRNSRFIAQENPPFLGQKYTYFARMNLATITLAAIHTLIILLVVLLHLLPQKDTISDFPRVLIGNLIPVAVGSILVIYDIFYASKKIMQRDLANYGIDFFFFGLLGTIFGYFVGFYLMIKGLFVMIIALTDRAVFAWKYNKTFREILYSFVNKFASGLGFIILILKNPFIQSDPWNLIYYYLAWGALLIDFFILRYLVNHYHVSEVPMWIAVLKLMLGVTASSYWLSGIILVFEGFFMILSAIFRYEPQPSRYS